MVAGAARVQSLVYASHRGLEAWVVGRRRCYGLGSDYLVARPVRASTLVPGWLRSARLRHKGSSPTL